MNVVFVVIGLRISKSIVAFNNGQLALIADEAEMSVQGTQQEIRARRRTMVNMWLIIGTISFIATYETLYSAILFIWGDRRYCFVVKNYQVVSASTVFARSLQFLIWYYPIIWLFWPPAPSCCRKKASHRNQDGKLRFSDERGHDRSGQQDDETTDGKRSSYDERVGNDDPNLLFLGPNVSKQNGLVF